jgi:hypothetical protein
MATGNVAQTTDKEAGGRKTTKAKAKAAKPEPEKVETAAAPEAEAAPETNGEQQVDELVTEEETLKVPERPEATPAPAPTGIQEQISKDRQDLVGKMMSGQEEGQLLKLDTSPQFIDAPIFPDAYCPLCGQKLSGNSKTGFKMAFYTHPFTPAIALGKPCVLKGKRLRAPVVRMFIVD